MTMQAERYSVEDLRALANACHDLATRYLVRFIDAEDQRDTSAAASAWQRYQAYWQAELLAVTTDEVDRSALPAELRSLLDNAAIAGEIAAQIAQQQFTV